MNFVIDIIRTHAYVHIFIGRVVSFLVRLGNYCCTYALYFDVIIKINIMLCLRKFHYMIRKCQNFRSGNGIELYCSILFKYSSSCIHILLFLEDNTVKHISKHHRQSLLDLSNRTKLCVRELIYVF